MRRDEINLSEPPNNDRPGDRWMCGRTGEPCVRGPIGRGQCSSSEPCRPRRTWHGRRKRWTLVGMLTIVAAMIVIARPATRAAIVKPGELSTPHAQILSSTLDSRRCAACHPHSSAVGDSVANVTQSDRCMDCHHETMNRSTATLAHNLPARVRSDLRLASLRLAGSSDRDTTWRDWMPSVAVDQENVQCNACHREHRGAVASLTAMTNDQCQTCHSDRFGSFADSHPTWDQWPYGRGGVIAFDHASHATKHFPKTILEGQPTSFECGVCHARQANGELTRTTSYETACQTCHDGALRIEAAEGVELLTLPSVAKRCADAIGAWPEGATGFYDGRIAGLADLLIRVDADANAAMRSLPNQDFAKIDDQHDQSEQAARIVAREHRQLLETIGNEGQSAMVERFAKSGISPSIAARMIRSLPPQLIEEACRRWFADEDNLAETTSTNAPKIRPAAFKMPARGDDDLLGESSDDDLLGDPLDSDPLDLDSQETKSTVQQPSRFDADAMLPAGGWFRDDRTFAIRYRGEGHDDPVLKAAIELAGELTPGDPARTRLLETKSLAACIACHPAAIAATRTSDERWRSYPLVGRPREFTKFAHSPHLNIAGLSDCRHCHTIAAGSVVSVSANQHGHEFAAVGIEACAGCHQSSAAGDACVKCHRYHVETSP